MRERENLSLHAHVGAKDVAVFLHMCMYQWEILVCLGVRRGVYLCMCLCVCIYVCACARMCVSVSVLILPVKMILQPSLISSSLSKQRKRRLVTPPPLLLSVSSFILCSTSVYLRTCVCARVCVHARTQCVFVCVWAQRFYVKLHRKGKSQAESPWQQNVIAAQWTIFCRADPAILSFL